MEHLGTRAPARVPRGPLLDGASPLAQASESARRLPPSWDGLGEGQPSSEHRVQEEEQFDPGQQGKPRSPYGSTQVRQAGHLLHRATSVAELQALWSGETPDERWTTELSEYLEQTAVAAGLEPSTVDRAECATTLCRVRLHFGDLGGAAEFQDFAQNPDIEYRGDPKPDGEGWSVELYVARQGD